MQVEIKPPRKEFDLDLERRALGATMHSVVSRKCVLRDLTTDDFVEPAHKRIFDYVKEQDDLSLPVDVNRVLSEARTWDTGATDVILDVYGAAAQDHELRAIVKQVKQMTLHRRVWHLINTAVMSREEDDVAATDHLFQALATGKEIITNTKPAPRPLNQVLASYIEKLKDFVLGVVPKAYDSALRPLGGYFRYVPQCLYVVGARPGMGKTAFAFGEALAMARQGLKVLFVSKEMSSEQLMQRLITAKTAIPGVVLRDGHITERDVERISEVLKSFEDGRHNIDIVDEGINTPEDIRSWLDSAPISRPYDVVFLDYLQLLNGGDNKATREQIVGDNSWKCKEIAKEYNIPFVALAQLSRNLTQRQDKRPNLGDLRESGRIEQDADVVGFLHREEYFGGPEQLGPDIDGNMSYWAEFIVAKNRHGQTGTAHIKWCPTLTVFTSPKPDETKENY